ncbi:hypothetical protein KGF57_000776 [Candida theae]|uniref:C2H2-type domain-containing protein n=1 Tax=Candida theae TaxID=1198502 RepID=A0AAD5BIK3_9ASCO|nr:uncharacterized protein KGF57_000776 [Candida theae]KAI5965510.1 hypothetical protein KGF57_000776 [Candida theae]
MQQQQKLEPQQQSQSTDPSTNQFNLSATTLDVSTASAAAAVLTNPTTAFSTSILDNDGSFDLQQQQQQHRRIINLSQFPTPRMFILSFSSSSLGEATCWSFTSTNKINLFVQYCNTEELQEQQQSGEKSQNDLPQQIVENDNELLQLFLTTKSTAKNTIDTANVSLQVETRGRDLCLNLASKVCNILQKEQLNQEIASQQRQVCFILDNSDFNALTSLLEIETRGLLSVPVAPIENGCFACSDCDKPDVRTEHVKHYIRLVSSNISSYHCQYCERKFSRLDSSASRMKIHFEVGGTGRTNIV